MNPDDYTNQILQVDVGDGQTLYVQDWGNKDATPILFLHGGPGNGVKDRHKLRFDPAKQRVIFYDQRGAGQSTPYGTLENNTTEHLVEDIEKIADKLNLEQMFVTGVSWGSTLALAYALKYPRRIKTMVLQGIFTGSKQEIDYLEKGLFRSHFPDAWDTFVANTPQEFRGDPADYHMQRIVGSNEMAAIESAKIYGTLEGSVASLDDRVSPINEVDFDHNPIKLEVHYMLNGCFMPDRYILNNAQNITVPVWLVQGRYDFVCPPATAYELHQKLPNSQLIWTQAGHGNDRNNFEVMRSLLLQASV